MYELGYTASLRADTLTMDAAVAAVLLTAIDIIARVVYLCSSPETGTCMVIALTL